MFKFIEMSECRLTLYCMIESQRKGTKIRNKRRKWINSGIISHKECYRSNIDKNKSKKEKRVKNIFFDIIVLFLLNNLNIASNKF